MQQVAIIPPLFHFLLTFSAEFGMNWVTNVLRPATKVMEGKLYWSLDLGKLMTYIFLDFLNNQELPEAKSLSARACALLTVKDKDVRWASIR